jgi:hypothetical protein
MSAGAKVASEDPDVALVDLKLLKDEANPYYYGPISVKGPSQTILVFVATFGK